MSKPRVIILFVIGLMIIVIAVFGVFTIINRGPNDASEGGTLTIWRVYDSDDSLDDIIDQYRVLHPQVKFSVIKVPEDDLREHFLEALARDEQPDIITIHATRLREFQEFLEPMPVNTKLSTLTTSRAFGIKEEQKLEIVTYPSPSIREIGERFVRTVRDDVVIDNQVYGLPFAVDSLALYYNQALLDRAGIALPPRTYSELLSDIPGLTVRDDQGNIVQSAIALGTANNIDHHADILSLLMMQNGATMTTNTKAVFNEAVEGRKPGQQAVEFYLGFATPTKEAYTWNQNLTNARDMFSQGNLAFYLGYAYELPIIQSSAAPGVEVSIAKAPQTSETPLNYADYWVETVVSKSELKNTAWNFILYAANQSNVTKYLEKTHKPAALRALVQDQQQDVDLGVFAEQALTATTWYDGKDVETSEQAFTDMIDSLLRQSSTIDEALSITAKKVTETLQ